MAAKWYVLHVYSGFENKVAQSIRDQVAPPTINLENTDPACAALGLNFTPNVAVKKDVRAALDAVFDEVELRGLLLS